MKLPQPGIVAHADWSTTATKRWLCVAEHSVAGYRILTPEPVGDAASLPMRLKSRARGGGVFLGVDFPLGIPLEYAKLAGVKAFTDFLPTLGRGDWSDFFEICESVDEISPRRPFYPKRPGGTRQSDLYRALGFSSIDPLRRRAEAQTAIRGAASPLFWTLGAQQVGRAAIAGWRDMLQPALSRDRPPIRLWPFEGGLASLLSKEAVVIAETYPAESALHVGLTAPGRGWSKRRQSDRATHAHAINRWAVNRRVTLAEGIRPLIRDGFGDIKNGEDQFDALVGVAGMLEVVLGHRPEMPPMSNERRVIEGWILGQRA